MNYLLSRAVNYLLSRAVNCLISRAVNYLISRVVNYLINICCVALLWLQEIMPCLSLRVKGLVPQVRESRLSIDSSGHYVFLDSLMLNVLAVVSCKRKILISNLLKS